jgi:hypothetical protein
MQKPQQRYYKMIDFIKLSIKDISLIDYFKNNDLLEWLSNENKFNRYDPEIINTKDKYQYKGIIFCFYPNELKISFLPHYYFNNNLHNANDFKVLNCIKVINDFKTTFKIDLTLLKIINLEYGLNVISPIDIKDLITYLAYHNQNEFFTDTEYTYSKKSYKRNSKNKINDYKIIKAYAKGLQFPQYIDKNTFRFEVKSNQSKYFNQFNIYNLNDLLNIDVYNNLSKELENEFKGVLILDNSQNINILKPKQQTYLNQYLNPNYWYRIKQGAARNKFNKEKTKYYKLISILGDNIKTKLENNIKTKLEFLKSGAYSTPLKNIKSGAYSTLYNSGTRTDFKNRYCTVTNIDISMQKIESIFLSYSGLRYYYNNDKKTFEQLKTKYLSRLWLNSDIEIQIKELAHNIRNQSSNQRIKQYRIYKPMQQNLLNTFDFV